MYEALNPKSARRETVCCSCGEQKSGWEPVAEPLKVGWDHAKVTGRLLSLWQLVLFIYFLTYLLAL